MCSVDVIVPCYRYGRFLRECVGSVLQEGPNVRVLIIDDASPDDSGEVGRQLASEDPRITFYQHRTNLGHVRTYNEGIEWVSASHMLLLSADDYVLPGALTRAAALMDRDPDIGFVFGSAVDLMEHGTVHHTETLPNEAIAGLLGSQENLVLGGRQFFELIQRYGAVNIVRTPTAVVQTALQKRVGGYRPALPHSCDFEMWLRLAAHAPVGVIRQYQAVYRLHGDNMQHQYYHARRLADLQQRRAAIDVVFQQYRSLWPDQERLHRRLVAPLAREAVRAASGALNDRDLGLSRDLVDFALSTSPGIRRSLPWIKFQGKRLMGRHAAEAIEPVVSRARQTFSRWIQ